MSTQLVTVRWKGTAWHAEVAATGATLESPDLSSLRAAGAAALDGAAPNLVFRLGDDLDDELRRFTELRYRADATAEQRYASLAATASGLDVLGVPVDDGAAILGIKPEQLRRVLAEAG